MTYEFVARLLDAAHVGIQSVRVDAIQEDVFFGVVTLRQENKDLEIDARPSDAIALAVRTGAPIYVAPAVLEKHAIPVPPSARPITPPRGIEQLQNAWQTEMNNARALSQRSPEYWKQSQQELVDFVFGSN
jgi:bifunctional DNase/RNase